MLIIAELCFRNDNIRHHITSINRFSDWGYIIATGYNRRIERVGIT
jgi:hypothetical protein